MPIVPRKRVRNSAKTQRANPGWFVADASNPGQFMQVGMPTG